ncbi:MAG: DsbA family protein [Defluviitaleaceae bacterium]|nr:DsbA family protein [Defluviitaleaceae bacterium]
MEMLEIFFDYHCPYCLKGHAQLLAFAESHPDVELIWHPCEIYKLPGNVYGTKRTDNYIQGMYFAAESGADLWQYHRRVYDLIFSEKVNIENAEVFAKSFEGLLDVSALSHAIKNNKYGEKVAAANNFAFHETGIHVVPTYRADEGFLQDRQEFFNMGYSDTAYAIINGRLQNVD